MWAAFRSSWSLFMGMILLMISNGLLVTLLTLRADGLGFSESTIGLIQSAYPVGSLIGCLIAPKLIMRVGHIRIFAAFASIASATALIHLVTNDPLSWGAMRLLQGFCFSGLYIVAESWLNGSASNETRASLLSTYFITQTGGVMIGQLLLNLSSPEGIFLFIVVSVLISFSLVPMLVSASAIPPYVPPERISLAELFRLSPMGLTGSFLNGIGQTALYIALALYGRAIGLSAGAIGGLIGFMTLGGMLFQFPLAKLSDRLDRRLVIVGAPGLAIPVCLFLATMESPVDNSILLFALVAVLGGLTLPIYSICMAHMNDHLKPGQVVAASGTLVLILAVGMTFGPTLGGFAIAHFGPEGLFYLLATTSGLTVMTGLFRLRTGQSRSQNQITAVALSANLSPEASSLYRDASNPDRDDSI
ncbi:MAG: MFS transporter [Alphaproteobacteria bacterium]|jgi:MFS family permease|nr:MFS transporter [Alphaproteobacteria bacterium]MBT7747744.1 MFS transporter [Alphaproteobacteria bacterium]